MLMRHKQHALFEAESGTTTDEGGTEGKPAKVGRAVSYSQSYVDGLTREMEGYKARLGTVEAEFSAHRTSTAAALAEATSRAAAADGRVKEAIRDSALKLAARDAGMIDPDALKLLDLSEVAVSDDGKVSIPAKFFENAKAAKAYLFQATGADSGNTSGTGSPPPAKDGGGKVRAMAMTDDEYAAAKAAITR